jgi:hypothetical protein
VSMIHKVLLVHALRPLARAYSKVLALQQANQERNTTRTLCVTHSSSSKDVCIYRVTFIAALYTRVHTTTVTSSATVKTHL